MEPHSASVSDNGEEKTLSFSMEFPWWPYALKANSRTHWAVKAKAASKYKSDCCMLAKTKSRPVFTDRTINIDVTFHPKTKHAVDEDNCISGAKYLFDGLALAWGVDDKRFKLNTRISDPVRGGKVVVRA